MHAAGLALLAGRLVHPLGIDAGRSNHPLRGIGSALTTLSMLICIFYLAWEWLG